MKRIEIIVLFFISFFLLTKVNGNSSIDLKVGKTYLIETIHFVDTTKTNPIRLYDKRWYSLYVADFNDEQKFYNIKLSMPYAHFTVQQRTNFGNWKETDFFITGFEQTKGYPPLSSTFALNNHTLSLQLRPSGVVSKIFFADYTFFNASTGMVEKYTQENLLQFENEIRSLFLIDSTHKTLETLWDRPNEKMIQIVDPYHAIKDEIRINKSNGLIAERKYTFKDSTVLYEGYSSEESPKNFGMKYQKWINVKKEASTYLVSGMYKNPKPQPISNTNTILCGKIDDFKEDILSITNTENFKKYQTSINDTGYFQFNIPISDYSEWIFSMNNIFKGIGFLRLNPGDSLFLNISKRSYRLKSVRYSGIGAKEMNAFSSAAKREYVVAPTRRNQPVKIVQKPNSKSPDAELIAFRQLAHPDSYLALYFRKHYNDDRIERYLKSPDSKAQFILNNSLAIHNWQYQHFLQQYLEDFLWEEIGKETYYENGKMATPFRYLYHLCEIILNEPIRYYYQLKLLERALVESPWEKSDQLAIDFFDRYAQFEKTDELKAFYEELAKVSPGKSAPDFNLPNLNENKVQLSRLKGEVVLLNFFDIRNNKSISFLKEIKENMGHIQRIYPEIKAYTIVCTNNEEHLKSNIKDQYTREHLLYIQSDEIPELLQKYYYVYDATDIYYIIAKDGTIFNIEHDFLPGNNTNLSSAISEPYKKISNEAQIKFLWYIIIFTLSVTLLLLAYFYFSRYIHRQQMRQADLLRKIKELENRAIRSQMNPHFIFNALNSIQGLVNQNNIDSANLYLAKFASLLRGVLNNSEHFEVTLAEELQVVRLYCEMEQLRVDFDLFFDLSPNLETEFIKVPALLLQPLVENAIIHGLSPIQGDKKLTIKVSQDEQYLIFKVIDNGNGLKPPGKDNLSKKGFGVKLVRDKLEILHNEGKFANLEVKRENDTTQAIILIEV